MNIVMTIMAGSHPVQVAVKQVKGSFEAKTLGQHPVEAKADTFNGVLDAIAKRVAYSVDNEAA